MEFVRDLAEYESLIPLFQEQVGSYYVSGMMSSWDLIAGQPVRSTPTSVELSEGYFSWSRIRREVAGRKRLANLTGGGPMNGVRSRRVPSHDVFIDDSDA
jgi:hypothetical protein